MSNEIRLLRVDRGRELDEIRALFLEYAASLGFSLCFQNFDKELESLPGAYAEPAGRLILCNVDGAAAGCVALKRLGPSICEMKRLFVRPQFRGKGLGLQLAERIIGEARDIGYTAMRLDTLRGRMDNAIALYSSLGFKEIPPYYENPMENAVYMELMLGATKSPEIP
jgi:ribosomal protein S18 acetylase RimI-like enzyme